MGPPLSRGAPPRPLAAVALALLLVASLAASWGAAGTAAAAPADADTERVAVLVGFQETPDPAVIRAHGGTVTDAFQLVPVLAATVPRSALAALEREPAVAYVERDERVDLVTGPTRAREDPGSESVPWGVERVGADAVQADGIDGTGVVVALLDTGIDRDHPELAGSYAGGVDLVDGDPVPEDDNGHGTHLAGIVAAAADGQGVVGVAPDVSLYGVKVANASGNATTSDIIRGIQWAIAGRDGVVGTDDDADVISMSLASFVGPESLRAAVEAAYREHGVLVVAGAGNSGDLDYPDTVTFPARYGEVVAVGAVDRRGARPPWSGAGPRLELAAPGVAIPSTAVGGGTILGEGTSMAAPHVAGVAALMLDSEIPTAADLDGDDAWDAVELRAWLRATATDRGRPGRDGAFGHGVVDAAAAVGAPRENAPPRVDVTAPEGPAVAGTVLVRATVVDPEEIDALLSVSVAVDGTRVGTAVYNGTARAFEFALAPGTLADGDRHRITVTATDGEGATASDAVVVRVDSADGSSSVAGWEPANGSARDAVAPVAGSG